MTRVPETTREEFEASSQIAFVDGIIAGISLSQNIGKIIENAKDFGRDEVDRGNGRTYGTVCDGDQLRSAVLTMAHALFGGLNPKTALNGIIRTAIESGIVEAEKVAREIRERQAIKRLEDKYPETQNALLLMQIEHAAMVEKGSTEKVPLEMSEKFFEELHKMPLEEAIHFLKTFCETKIPFDTRGKKASAFINKSLTLITTF